MAAKGISFSPSMQLKDWLPMSACLVSCHRCSHWRLHAHLRGFPISTLLEEEEKMLKELALGTSPVHIKAPNF